MRQGDAFGHRITTVEIGQHGVVGMDGEQVTFGSERCSELVPANWRAARCMYFGREP